ncbi:MAG: HAMP domain-containing histidine kinase [Flavobacteriales bacterium]|nr:HAMP domain-containing histidine kinase [Flavobacteriales bacterium]
MKEEFTKKLGIKVAERTVELEKAQLKLALSLEKEKELGELKSRSVATASHQFRTPLTVIQSSMGILAMQMDSMDAEFRPRFEKVYDRIKGQIGRMTDLMNDVLILGKINAGSVKPVLKSIDLIEMCKGVIESYDDTQEDGRKMKVKIAGKARNLKLDTKLMEHAISNLISNAFKYSVGKEAPEFHINFYSKEVRVVVKDKGMGIPENDVQHLFEPFYRASNVEEISGTGLGTAIAKEYIELNNGSIEVVTKVNHGTVFTVVFKK